jgi:hypothetical protein
MGQILAVAEQVLRENSIPPEWVTKTVDDIRKVRLTESRKKLMFVYAETLRRLRK